MRKPVFAAVAALLVCASCTSSTLAQQKIAIANPIKILNELAETKAINKAFEDEQAAFKQQYAARDAKLKDIQAKRDQVKTDSPQWADLNKELVQQRSESQAWAQQSQIELARKFRDQARRMNEKITATIADVAKTKSIDLVIADQKPEVTDAQLENMQPQQVMNVLFGKNILYSNEALDLTQEVIARLDAVYKK